METSLEGLRQSRPVSLTERIVALDVLRGFAVLGILLINVQSFSMIGAAYLNPTANDKLDGAGFWVWAASFLLADQKFMTIFSILFGAGLVLMAGRTEARAGRPGWLNLRRQLVLLAFGMAHAYLVWYGDILVAYALCGLVAFWFRKLSPRALLLIGLLVFAVPSALNLMAQGSLPYWGPEDVAEQMVTWQPSVETIAEETAAYRGSWSQQMEQRVEEAYFFQTFLFLWWAGWRAGGLMLVGMALFRIGFLSAEMPSWAYRRVAIVALPVGLAVVAAGIWRNVQAGFAFEYSMFFGTEFNYWGSLLVSLGYIAVMMLAVQGGWMVGLQQRLGAVGRMALTNYLTQSLLATFVFYGHGLGLFEAVPRLGQLGVVVAIWALQLAWSPWWLARFRFGPFEWLWRSLTYMKAQPMRL